LKTQERKLTDKLRNVNDLRSKEGTFRNTMKQPELGIFQNGNQEVDSSILFTSTKFIQGLTGNRKPFLLQTGSDATSARIPAFADHNHSESLFSFYQSLLSFWTTDGMFCLLTTFNGEPAKNDATLSAAMLMSLCRAASEAQEIWGVKMQFGADRSGLSARIGSWATTSRPAPAICPD
jgi:hypothetical protein